MDAGKLVTRQELFAREYVIDLNGTRAAIAAGYSENTANEQASRMLANDKIRARVDELLSKRAQRCEVEAYKVIEELARLAFCNMSDFLKPDENGQLDVDFSKLTRDQAAAIQEYTVDTTGGSGDGERRRVLRTKFKLADKRGALELLGKHLKLFTDKLEVSNTPISDEELDNRLKKFLGINEPERTEVEAQ